MPCRRHAGIPSARELRRTQGGACSRRVKCEPQAGAVWPLSHGSRGSTRSTIDRGEDDLDATRTDGRGAGAPHGCRRAEPSPPMARHSSPALKRLVEPATLRRSRCVPLLWVSKSMDKLAEIFLTGMGHPMSADTVVREDSSGSAFRASTIAESGRRFETSGIRDAQFERIDSKVVAAQAEQRPVISVDAKKKEPSATLGTLVADYGPASVCLAVSTSTTLKTRNSARVDAVRRLRRDGQYRLRQSGHHERYSGVRGRGRSHVVETYGPQALSRRARLDHAQADCGGSNGARVRLWKVELQKLADGNGVDAARASHDPPGTSKWRSRIEHRMFCHITQNWRGRPLTDRVADCRTDRRPRRRKRG